MRLEILQKGGLQLNALFIQPTSWCSHSCRGCYVKDAKALGTTLPWWEIKAVFQKYYQSNDAWANQITVSLDGLSKDPGKRNDMLILASSILEVIEQDPRPKDQAPEVHLTVHSMRDLAEYVRAKVTGWSKLTMLSVSEIANTPEDVQAIQWFRGLGVKVNHNLLVRKDIVSQVNFSAQHCDSIYLIMPKNLGETRDQAKITMEDYANRVRDACRQADPNVRFYVDRCYEAVSTKTECSARISQFMVWPDGSVTGCPYANKDQTLPAKSLDGIVKNIRDEQNRGCYECVYKKV